MAIYDMLKRNATYLHFLVSFRFASIVDFREKAFLFQCSYLSSSSYS